MNHARALKTIDKIEHGFIAIDEADEAQWDCQATLQRPFSETPILETVGNGKFLDDPHSIIESIGNNTSLDPSNPTQWSNIFSPELVKAAMLVESGNSLCLVANDASQALPIVISTGNLDLPRWLLDDGADSSASNLVASGPLLPDISFASEQACKWSPRKHLEPCLGNWLAK